MNDGEETTEELEPARGHEFRVDAAPEVDSSLRPVNRRQVRAKGSVPEMLKMLPLAKPLCARYEQHLRAQGREDLIRAAG